MATYTLRDRDNKVNHLISSHMSINGVCQALLAKSQCNVSYNETTVYVFEEDVELALQMFPATVAVQSNGTVTRLATESQLRYLNILNVRVEPHMSMERASLLIDAAKHGILGSVNGFYTDGSN